MKVVPKINLRSHKMINSIRKHKNSIFLTQNYIYFFRFSSYFFKFLGILTTSGLKQSLFGLFKARKVENR